jgi:CDP-paratose 2-epimerase
MMRNLVTGGVGFIGVNLSDRLLGDGESVVVVDDFSRVGATANADWLSRRHPDVEIVEADLRRDPASLEPIVAAADVVYHLAGQVAVTSSVSDPRDDLERNLLGTFNLLEALRRTSEPATLVFASTNKVYGQLEGVPVDEIATRYVYGDGQVGISETQLLDFHSPYGCSKGAADQYVRDYARIFGVPTVVLRQSCIYGPRQFGIEDQGWLAWFAIAATLGRPVTIFGDGKQVRDVLHVSDLIELARRAVDRIDVAAGRVYNVGGGPSNTLSLLESLELLGQRLGRTVEYAFAEARPGDQRIYVSDIGKVSTELGWSPSVDPPSGIDELVSWITENRDLLVNAY